MSVAQRLYENGFITYMRTDSTSLSEAASPRPVVRSTSCTATTTARQATRPIPARPRTPRRRTRRSARQEKPGGRRLRSAGSWVRRATKRRLYDLIWKRTLASQMPDAKGESLSVRLGAIASDNRDAEFSTSGRVIQFPGFLKVYVESIDDPDADTDDTERRLPPLAVDDPLEVRSLEASGHETKPPRRYTEASLVQKLEELGVGRPSTYASIIEKILDRHYVWKKSGALVPSFTAFAVVASARTALPRPRGLRLHGTDGGGPRPHRIWRRAASRLAEQLLLGRDRAPTADRRQPRAYRRPRDQLDSDRDRRTRTARSSPGSGDMAPTWRGTTIALRSPTTSRPMNSTWRGRPS